MKNDDQLISVNQACIRYGVSRQAIFLCIHNKRLKAKKVNGKWLFTVQAWNDYTNSKYHRKFSIRDGKKIYDADEGRLSPSMVAEHFGLDKQKLYYLLRKGIIPHKRLGAAYIISRQDVWNNLEKIKKKSRK